MELKFNVEELVGATYDILEFIVGAKVVVNNNPVKVVEQKDGERHCNGCLGSSNPSLCHTFNCRFDTRKDGKNIIVEKDE